MSDITIQAKDNGPFIVKGDASITDGSGQPFETKSHIALCRCGEAVRSCWFPAKSNC